MIMRNLIIYVILLLVHIIPINAKNYAILISSGAVYKDTIEYSSEYWYDLYLAYENLVVHKGYDPQDVFVFYNGGRDFPTGIDRFKPSYNGWERITDYKTTFSELKKRFTEIGNIMTDEDNLIVFWVVGHGSNVLEDGTVEEITITDGEYYCIICNSNGLYSLYVDDIKNLMNRISVYNNRLMVWNTCYSGYLIYESFGPNTSVVTGTAYNQKGHSYLIGPEEIPLTEFGYYFNAYTTGYDFLGTAVPNIETYPDNIYDIEEAVIQMKNLFYQYTMSSETQIDIFYPEYDYNFGFVGSLVGNESGIRDYDVLPIWTNLVYTINSGADVNLAASEKVLLSKGFKVESNANVRIYLDQSKLLLPGQRPKSESIVFLNADSHSNDDLTVYPVPANQNINFDFKNFGIYNFWIADINGRVVFNDRIGGNLIKLDVTEFTNGIYHYKISAENYDYRGVFIVNNHM